MIRGPFRFARSLLSAMLLVAITLALCEAVARLYLSTQVGRRIILYGTRLYRVKHNAPLVPTQNVGDYRPYSEEGAGTYAKYLPNKTKRDTDPDTHEPFELRTNSRGFRGRDFEIEKAPGVVRVLTLGASSTFGFHNRDDETYPYYLEEMLNDRCQGHPAFEVINFGIPHLTSHNILALFRVEGVEVQPDIVTFYEGINDAWSGMTPEVPGSRTLVVLRLVEHLLEARRQRYPWTEEQAERRSQAFLSNLDAILEECRRRGIRFVVASQQVTSLIEDRDARRGLRHDDEVKLVREKLAANGALERWEWIFLTHAHMMQELERWAREREVPYADALAALDRDRQYLVSWVHLHPKGNRIVAAALADEILNERCP